MGHRVALGLVVLAACQTPKAAAISPPATPTTLPELVTKVGAALSAGRVDDARALIGERAGDCFGEVGAIQRRDGGFVLRGGRVTARLDPRGRVEAYRLEPGCVDLADEQITITHVTSDGVATYALHGAVEDSISFEDATIAVDSSPQWVAVTATDGSYLAWPRGAAMALHGVAPDEGGAAPRLAGRYLVTADAAAITLHRPDGTEAAVRGCTGRLMAAMPAPNGVALQVDIAAGSALCIVDDRGATDRVTALGTAVCGLGSRQPCPWDVAAVSPLVLVFAGMRGGSVIIDPATGTGLAYRDEPPSQFPPEYARCGDTVCVRTQTEERSEVGRLERVGPAVRYRRFTPPVDAATALRTAWCAEGDLLVPCAP